MNTKLDPSISEGRLACSPFAVARNRVFVTYGRTNEQFCLPSGVEVRYEKLIHDHLQRHGYEAVVFFSNRGCFFLDSASRDAVMGRELGGATAQRAEPVRTVQNPPGKLLQHTTGLKLLRRPRRDGLGAPHPDPLAGVPGRGSCRGRLRWADMANPNVMVPLVRRLLADDSRPTAVVFANDDIFATFSRTELNQQFQALVKHDVQALPTGNRNIVIFNFPGSDPWRSLQNHRWDFLLGGSPEHASGIATPVYLGEPEADEVCHYLLTLHLKHGLNLDALAFPRLVQRLTSHLKVNRQGLLALSPMRQAARLDAAAVERVMALEQRADRPAAEQLQSLIGMQGFKEYVAGKLKSVERRREREPQAVASADLHRLVPPPPPSWVAKLRLHLLLTGNPGTGKTTAARLLGELYREAGVLPLGHTITATRKDLVAGYHGQTALKVAEVVQRALAGVLFVDEAYDLCRGPEDCFGQEAINALVEAMSDLNGRLAVVLAGYAGDMERLVQTNDGLKSRFADILHLEDYRPDELEAILRQALGANPDLRLETDLDARLTTLCSAIYANRERTFGNARAMVQLAGTLHENMVREDAKQAGVRHLPSEYRAMLDQPAVTADGVLAELDRLIGLQGVKNDMRTLFNSLRAARLRGGEDARVTPGHFVFAGNPGTGKTTVARMVARQLQALGFLSTAQVHATTASKLIQGYVGQTTVATRDFLQAGLGKVIFIDEAHQLAGDGALGHDFGRDAVRVLVPFSEDHLYDCVIVLAGYPDALRRLLSMDVGLPSRFSNWITFEDYTAEEMLAIFDQMLRDRGIRWPAEECREFMCQYFDALRRSLKQGFGNARTVRQEVEACLRRLANRLHREGRLDASDAAAREAATCLTAEDLPVL